MEKKISKLIDIDKGMILPELIVSLVMLVSFGLVITISASFINRFLGEYSDSNTITDQINIKNAMDKWTTILSQQGYTREDIQGMECSYSRSKQTNPWDMPGKPNLELPSNYQYCIYSTSLKESKINDLILKKPFARPGIYILYARPDQKAINTLPIRRIFCRPRPYC